MGRLDTTRARRRLIRPTLLTAGLALVACSGSGHSPSAAVAPPGPPTTTAGTYPLTGLPADDAGRLGRPALTVKIENEPAARPQSGLQAADVVYETLIEGGDTRFLAVFQSTDADPIGSIRSVRPTDPDLVAPIGGLFAYSGGTPKFVGLLRAAPVIDLGQSADADAYFIRSEKSSDHKLFSSTTRLYAAPQAASAKPPPALFPFLAPGARFEPPGATPASHLDAVVGNQRIGYDWDASAGWRRSISGRPHVSEGGEQLTATNVIVQSVTWAESPGDVDAIGSQVYVAQLEGSGDAWVLSDGKAVKATWSKSTSTAITTYTTTDGKPVALQPGRTWVELSGRDTPPTLR